MAPPIRNRVQPGDHVDLTFDSGAFSFWRKGFRIDVREYMAFLEYYADVCPGGYVTLDVMPGQPGSVRTSKIVEESASLSFSNTMAMKKAGFNPIPVYHMGERRYWLEKMLGEGFDHIGVSPNITLPSSSKRPWLDEVFGYLCGSKGYPSVKVHGFGVTSVPLMWRYPWFSTDSISWMKWPAYGWVPLPYPDANGDPDFSGRPRNLGVSKGGTAGSSHLTKRSGVHFEHFGEKEKEYVRRYFEVLGCDHEAMKTVGADERQKLCVRFYKKVEELINARGPKPFYQRSDGLFSRSDSPHGTAVRPDYPFRMLYTINIGREHSDTLENEGCRNRLLSYSWFRDMTPFDIREYVRTGRIGKVSKRNMTKGK